MTQHTQHRARRSGKAGEVTHGRLAAHPCAGAASRPKAAMATALSIASMRPRHSSALRLSTIVLSTAVLSTRPSASEQCMLRTCEHDTHQASQRLRLQMRSLHGTDPRVFTCGRKGEHTAHEHSGAATYQSLFTISECRNRFGVVGGPLGPIRRHLSRFSPWSGLKPLLQSKHHSTQGDAFGNFEQALRNGDRSPAKAHGSNSVRRNPDQTAVQSKDERYHSQCALSSIRRGSRWVRSLMGTTLDRYDSQ